MKTMMKLSSVFFVMSSVLPKVALADSTQVLIAVESGPGYVSKEDEYGKECMIDVNGLLTYQYWTPPFEVPAKVKTYQLSARELSKVKNLIDEARTHLVEMPVGKREYETYAGDAPGFDIEVFPPLKEGAPTDPMSFTLRGDGRDLTVYSKSAKKLERKLGHLCGMSFEFKKIRLALKQMARH